MRANKIKLGFHRLGLVLGAIPIIAVAITIVFHSLTGGIESNDFQVAVACLGAAIALYAACWVLGWIIAGFMGNEP